MFLFVVEMEKFRLLASCQIACKNFKYLLHGTLLAELTLHNYLDAARRAKGRIYP